MTKALYFTESGYRKLLNNKKKLEAQLAETKKEAGLSAEADPGNVWHDNAPFEEAERNIHRLTSMIEDVMRQLDSAKIVKLGKRPKDKVGIGSKVKVKIDGETHTYLIGGWGETELKKGKISYASPLGKALMGAKLGSRKKTTTPEGKLTIEILKIL